MPPGHFEQPLAIVERFDQVQAWYLGADEQSLHPPTSLDQRQMPEMQEIEGIDGALVDMTIAHGPSETKKIRGAVSTGKAKLGTRGCRGG